MSEISRKLTLVSTANKIEQIAFANFSIPSFFLRSLGATSPPPLPPNPVSLSPVLLCIREMRFGSVCQVNWELKRVPKPQTQKRTNGATSKQNYFCPHSSYGEGSLISYTGGSSDVTLAIPLPFRVVRAQVMRYIKNIATEVVLSVCEGKGSPCHIYVLTKITQQKKQHLKKTLSCHTILKHRYSKSYDFWEYTKLQNLS